MLLRECFERWLKAGSTGLVLVLAACQTATPSARQPRTAEAASVPPTHAPTPAKQACTGPNATFCEWPDASSPNEIGRRVAENFAARELNFTQGKVLVYQEACAWYGALTAAQLMHDRDLSQRLVQKFEPLLTPEYVSFLPAREHVDDRVFGIAPLEIYLQTGDTRHLAMGRAFADKQWEKTTSDGISVEARYWVDDMYMITSLQTQAFRATKDARYLDRAAQAMDAYLTKLQQQNGLFFHTASSPVHWARGNGWYAAGMTELLRSLPSSHPRHATILQGFRKMMAGLLPHQTDEGTWRQVIDNPAAWVESSGSAMFTFAFISGVKHGWLDSSVYGIPARKAWLGVIRYLDEGANLRDVCIGTGEAATSGAGTDPSAQMAYYLARPRSTGDLHGQAPILWAASALLR